MLKLYTMALTETETLKRKLLKMKEDDSGAAMIEYAILIGLITVAVIAAVIAVGGWVQNAWESLQSALGV